MKKLILYTIFIFSSSAAADNFATCVLDRMPDSQNDAATYAVMQACHKKYPGGYQDIPQGTDRGWLGYDSGAECAAKKAAGTQNNKAGGAIRVACNCLYDPPKIGKPSCEEQHNMSWIIQGTISDSVIVRMRSVDYIPPITLR